ncbi:ABC transporter permease [Salmonirosea aquatica]|uniref:ABC transporter permease subunit n=1 Tax=Salmonirosea aquatica TaxID=2654236 RepID=A0A7C9BGG7_9BACT|nr:ABC transporter permease subunit [Cytophagaceae bacterium SJW1-29]
MKFWKIFRYELAYLARRISTWLYLVVLLAFVMGMNQVIKPGDGVYPNNTFLITALTVLGGLIWLVIGASIAGEAAARDVQTRIHPLVYTTPVSRSSYLSGKFMAAFAVNALLLLSLPVGILLFFYLPGLDSLRGIDQGELLPFRPTVYLNVYCLIALPNAFVATALQFALAKLTRQVAASYMASLLLAVFPQMIAVGAANLFGNWDLLKVLDPVGVAGIIGNELQTWTPSEKNTRQVTLEGMYLWNRILWLGVALGLLWLTYLRFSRTNPETNRWWSRFSWRPKVQAKKAETAIVSASAISVPQVRRGFGFATHFHQTLTIAWDSFGKIARHPMGLTLVSAICLASAAFSDQIIAEFGIPLLPTTQQVVNYLAAPVSSVNTPGW